jgi:photosystem II stability/assembly factor-like uncharacterized protein
MVDAQATEYEWRLVESPTDKDLNSVFMLSENEGWAVGEEIILHWNGATWSESSTFSGIILESVYMTSPAEGWATGTDYSTTPWEDLTLYWDGTRWFEENTTPSVHVSSENYKLAIRAPPSRFLLSSDNERVKIEEPPNVMIYSVHISSLEEVWGVGRKEVRIGEGEVEYHGVILRWSNGGWQEVMEDSTVQSFYSIWMVSPTNGWVVGGSKIFKWDGESWTEVGNPTQSPLYSIHMLSETEGWAVGGGGSILYWDGSEWFIVESPTNKSLWEIRMLFKDEAWVVGSNGIVLHYGPAKVIEGPNIQNQLLLWAVLILIMVAMIVIFLTRRSKLKAIKQEGW